MLSVGGYCFQRVVKTKVTALAILKGKDNRPILIFKITKNENSEVSYYRK
jgi:hypothetical protein